MILIDSLAITQVTQATAQEQAAVWAVGVAYSEVTKRARCGENR